MLIFAVIVLSLLGLMNRIWGKSFAYPPALFCMLWAALLLLLRFSLNSIYPITAGVVCFYLLQAVLFSAGGFSTRELHSRGLVVGVASIADSSHERRRVRRILDCSLILLLLSTPSYWNYIQGLADSYGGVAFWVAVRLRSIDSETSSEFSLISSLVPLSIITAILMMYEDDGTLRRRARTYIAATLSFLINFLTAASAGATLLAFAIVGVYWIKKRRVSVSFAAFSATSLILVLILLAVLVGKGSANYDNALSDNIPAVTEFLQLYTLGGVVGFDAILQRPNTIPGTWPIYRNFIQVANKFGAGFDILPLHADFISMGRGPSAVTNVYTMYFSYLPDFGPVGCSLIVLMLGFVCSYVYWAARQGGPVATVLYALLFNAVLISPFAEQFFLGFNLIFKAVTVTAVVYNWPRIRQLLSLCSSHPLESS